MKGKQRPTATAFRNLEFSQKNREKDTLARCSVPWPPGAQTSPIQAWSREAGTPVDRHRPRPLHVLLLLLVVLLLVLHVLLQKHLVLLAQQLDLAQEVVVFFLQVPLETGQQLEHRSTMSQMPCDPEFHGWESSFQKTGTSEAQTCPSQYHLPTKTASDVRVAECSQ